MELFNIAESAGQYCKCGYSILWMRVFNIVNAGIQCCECEYSILWMRAFNIVNACIQYCECVYSILWIRAFNIVNAGIHYCECRHSILWMRVFNIVNAGIQYCVCGHSMLWMEILRMVDTYGVLRMRKINITDSDIYCDVEIQHCWWGYLILRMRIFHTVYIQYCGYSMLRYVYSDSPPPHVYQFRLKEFPLAFDDIPVPRQSLTVQKKNNYTPK